MPRPRTYAGITRYSLERMPKTLKMTRRKRKLSAREAAREIGLTRTTYARIEAGEDTGTGNLVRIFAWLDGST